MTLDGKIAATTGHSAWITQPESRRWVHELRSTCDAVIIGGNTVRKDNPNLTTHGISDHQPHRIVLTQTLDLPTQAHLWDVSIAPTIVIAPPHVNPEVAKALRDQGVELMELDTVTPDGAMQLLYDRGLSQVLWECGGKLAAAALQDDAVQKIYAFIAPKIIGGQDAPSPIGDLGLREMTKAIELQEVRLQSMASDFLVEGYLKR